MFCKNLKMSLPLYDFYMVLNASFFEYLRYVERVWR